MLFVSYDMDEVAFMAAFIIMAVLAAFGAVCALWVLLGFLLPRQQGAAAVLICRGDPTEEYLIRRYLWLYDLGLVRCPLILVDCGMAEPRRRTRGIIRCTPEELLKKLEQEM